MSGVAKLHGRIAEGRICDDRLTCWLFAQRFSPRPLETDQCRTRRASCRHESECVCVHDAIEGTRWTCAKDAFQFAAHSCRAVWRI